MAPDSSCLLLGWLLVLSLAVFVGQEAAAYKLDPNDVPAPILDLTHRSFSLNSRLSIFSGGSKVVFQLDEMHSAWQKRSKLHFRAFGSPDSGDTQPKLAPIKEGSTIYCTDQDVLIWSGLSCSSISHDYVDILFNRGVLSGFDSGNLAGAARLLLFIEKNFAKFTLGSTEQMPANTMDKVRYVAEFSPLSGGLNEFSLTLLYDEVRANNLPHGIPRRVIIMIPRTKVVISYDFLRYTPIKVDQFLTANKVFKYSNNVFNDVGSIELDLFAIDRAIGCSQSMTQASTRGPGAISQTLEKIDKSRFSFSAKPPTPRGVSAIDLTVAYEPHFSILRVDNVRSTRSESTITDFQHDSKFNIIRRHSSDKDLVFDGVGISSDRDRSCVVSQVKAKGYKSGGGLKNPYTLGQMLLGTERLVYLGLARVRGIEARVYESYNCNWPIWLQQPSVYKELRGEHLNMSSSSSDQVGRLYLRDESKIIKARGLSLTNVFYFSSHGPPNQDDDDLLDSKLLLVEVFTKIDSGNHVRRHQYYPVYDFSWSLANSAPDGGRYEDLFSLHDDCLAEINYEQAASVDLLLETELHLAKQAWLLDRSRRNLALIYMAQNELDLTSTMLYDVESKSIMDSGQTYLDKNHRLASVAASIRVSQRTKSVTRLLYAGTAFVSREEDVNVYPAFNFHSCHMLAAHLRKNVIFAYEAPEFGCYLLKPELDGTSVASIMKNTFKFSDRAYVEVYQIFHPEAGDDDYIINELATIRSKTKQLHDLTLPDLTLADADILDPETSVHFKIKELHLNDVGNNYYTSDDGLHMSDTNKFSGYGLVASDGQNKLVQPKCIEDPETRIYHQNEMSFEHCQTACLADLDCRAYSVCIVEDQMQCVLSTVSFGTPSMVIQLMQLKRTGKKIKLGTKLPIKVDPNEQKFIVANSKLASKLESLESIQVVKHPNCELHNRLNRNLFTKSSQGATTMVNSLSSIRPVAHFEQCATLCFRMTVLRMIWNALGSNATRTQPEKTSSPSSSAGLAICGHVYYVDHETVASSIEPEYMKKLFEELNQQHDFVGGYCILDEPDRPTDERGLYDIFKDIKLDLYEFDFSTLYTKQKDVTLMTSEMDTGEFALLNEQPTIGGGPPPVLEANANFGTARETKSISECAKLCLNPQAKVAYPACRSFEYIEITKARDKKIVKFCGFNSVTLKSSLRAGRFDLIRHGADKQERVHLNPNLGTKVWHFDPREGIIEKTLDEVYKIVHARDLEVARETSSQLHVHGLGLFGIIMFTLSLGMIAGFVLGIRIITKLIPLTEDVENLVTDSPPEEPKILFCNMVDFEGHIVEQDQEEAPATDEPAPVLPVAETGENNA